MRRLPAGLVTALLAGIIFGFGLAFSRMTDPRKIKDFLDLAAIPSVGWDPSLAFVMGGGLIVAFFGLRVDRVLRTPLAAPACTPIRGCQRTLKEIADWPMLTALEKREVLRSLEGRPRRDAEGKTGSYSL